MKKTLAFLLALCMAMSFCSAMAEITYPLDDNLSIKVWIAMDAGNSQYLTNYGDSPVWQRFQEVTGVKIEFIHPTYGAEKDGFATMMAGGDLPDVIIDFGAYYNGGVVAAYEDEVIYDLTPYLEEYAPDYYAIINANDDYRRQFYTEDGKVLSFDLYALEDNPNAVSVILRADWCEEFGLVPAELDTYEEIEVYFQKILENKPGTVPFLNPLGEDGMRSTMWGYDLIPDFMCKDGKVVYYANTDEYRQWLTMMNRWYNNGYLGQDFSTAKGATIRKQFVAGEVGCQLLAIGNAYADCEAGGVAMDKGPYWLSTEDMTVHCYYLGVDKATGIQSVITTSCDEKLIPAICKFMNYCYTEEGAVFSCWGPEGISWDGYDEKGERKFTDWVVNNPTYTTSVMHNVCRLNYWPRAKYMDATCNPNVVKDPIVREMRRRYTVMDNYQTDWYIPAAVKYTVEETEDRSEIMTNVETFTKESMFKFIKGDLSVETDWDDYVKTLANFKLDKAVEITQTAYNRYLAQ